MSRAKVILQAAYSALPFKRQLFELLRPLRLPESVYQHLHFAGPFTVLRNGKPLFRMVANHEIVENELFWSGIGGQFEGMSLDVWCHFGASARGVLDIGANTGAYTLAARALNPRARIVAFEPVERISARLLENASLNGFQVEFDARAVSDSSGIATLFDGDAGAMHYNASLESRQSGNDHGYEVETVSIDEFLRNEGWPPIDLVKIDVETHEPAVLRGMKETIRRFHPAILIEVLFEPQSLEVAELLNDSGYLMFNIDEEGRKLIPTDKLGHIHGRSWNNLLCTPEQATLIQPFLTR